MIPCRPFLLSSVWRLFLMSRPCINQLSSTRCMLTNIAYTLAASFIPFVLFQVFPVSSDENWCSLVAEFRFFFPLVMSRQFSDSFETSYFDKMYNHQHIYHCNKVTSAFYKQYSFFKVVSLIVLFCLFSESCSCDIFFFLLKWCSGDKLWKIFLHVSVCVCVCVCLG